MIQLKWNFIHVDFNFKMLTKHLNCINLKQYLHVSKNVQHNVNYTKN